MFRPEVLGIRDAACEVRGNTFQPLAVPGLLLSQVRKRPSVPMSLAQRPGLVTHAAAASLACLVLPLSPSFPGVTDHFPAWLPSSPVPLLVCTIQKLKAWASVCRELFNIP